MRILLLLTQFTITESISIFISTYSFRKNKKTLQFIFNEKKCLDYYVMASQERFELPTDGLEGRCSIQLSYWDIIVICLLQLISDIFYYSHIGIICQHFLFIFL